jgi:hypothetical protein
MDLLLYEIILMGTSNFTTDITKIFHRLHVNKMNTNGQLVDGLLQRFFFDKNQLKCPTYSSHSCAQMGPNANRFKLAKKTEFRQGLVPRDKDNISQATNCHCRDLEISNVPRNAETSELNFYGLTIMEVYFHGVWVLCPARQI